MVTVLGVRKGESGKGEMEVADTSGKERLQLHPRVIQTEQREPCGFLFPLLFAGLVSVCDVQSSRSSWCRMRPVPISMPTAADHVLTSGQHGSLHPSSSYTTLRPLSSLENPKCLQKHALSNGCETSGPGLPDSIHSNIVL